MSARILTPTQAGVPILQALGLDAEKIVSLSLRIRANELPTLIIERYVTDENGIANLGITLRRYRLVLEDEVSP